MNLLFYIFFLISLISPVNAYAETVDYDKVYDISDEKLADAGSSNDDGSNNTTDGTSEELDMLHTNLQELLDSKDLGITYDQVLDLVDKYLPSDKDINEVIEDILSKINTFPYTVYDYDSLLFSDNTDFSIEDFFIKTISNKPFGILDSRIRSTYASSSIYLTEDYFHLTLLQLLETILGVPQGSDITSLVSSTTYLDLSWDGIHKIQSDDYLSGIGFFTNLKTLILRNQTMIRIGSNIRQLSNLEYLDLDSCSTKFLEDITKSDFPKLEYLDLTQSYLYSPSQLEYLQYLTSLKHLDLGYSTFYITTNSITLPSKFANLTSLEYLDLREMTAFTDLSVLSSLINLTYLDLTTSFKGSDLSFISNLVNLEHLSLKECMYIQDFSPLANLTNLKYLDLRRSSIATLYPLRNLSNLETLLIYVCSDLDTSTFKYLPSGKYTLLSPLNLDLSELSSLRFFSNRDKGVLKTDWTYHSTDEDTNSYTLSYVAPPAIKIKMSSVSFYDKTYDGTTNVDIDNIAFKKTTGATTYSLTKDIDYTATAVLDNSDVGSRTVTVTVTLLNIDYEMPNPTYTEIVTVSPAPLTISSITASDKIYDGTSDATITNVTFDGLQNGETLTLNTDYTVTGLFNNKNYSVSSKTVTGTVTLLNTTKASNYILSTTSAKTDAYISKRDIAISTITADDKTYDGTTTANISNVVFSNLVSGESLTLGTDFTVTGKFNSKNYSSSSQTFTGSISLLNTTNANNYNLTTTTSTTTAKINKAPLTISSITASNKTYDGTTTASITSVAFSGLKNNETLTLGTDYTLSAIFSDANVGTNKTVTATITLSTDSSTSAYNYSLSDNTKTTTASITKSSSELSNTLITNGNDVATTNFTFDDTLKVTTTPVIATSARSTYSTSLNTIDLIIGSEVVASKTTSENQQVTFQVNLNDTDLSSGTYTVKLSFGGDNNLNSSEVSLGNITIEPIQISGEFTQSEVFNGSKTFTYTVSNLRKLSTSQSVTDNLNTTVNVTLSSSNAGVYTGSNLTITPTITGSKANHYSMETYLSTISSFEITKKPISINSVTIQSKTYDGTTTATVSNVVFDGLVSGYSLTKDTDYKATATFGDKNVGTNKPFNATVTLSDTPTANNYTLSDNTYQGTNGIITSANSTISDTKITNGDNTETRTFTFEDILKVVATPILNTASARSAQSVTPNTMQLIIGDNIIDTKTASENQEIEFTVDLYDTILEVGTYEVKLVFGGDNNLNSSEVSLGNITINPILLTGEINYSATYNGETEFVVVLTKLKTKSSKISIPTITATSLIELPSKNVGTYTNDDFTVSSVNLTGERSSVFKIGNLNTDITGTININKRPISIQNVVADDKIYDTTTNAIISSVTFSGLVSNEQLTKDTDYKVKSAQFNTSDAGTNKEVTVTLELLDTPTANNYLLSEPTTTTTATITKAESSVENVSIKNGNTETTEFSLSDILTVTLTPTINKSSRSLLSLSEDKAYLYLNDIELASEDAYENQPVTFKVNLIDFDLDTGQYPLIVKYGGSTSLNTSETELTTLTLTPIELDASLYKTVTYTGNADFSVPLFITSDNNKDLLTASAVIESESSQVGTYSRSVQIQDVTLNGDNVDRYNLSTQNIDVSYFEIEPAVLTVGEVKVDDKIYDGSDVADVIVTLNGTVNNEVLVQGTDYIVTANFEDSNADVDKMVTIQIELIPNNLTSNYILNENQIITTATIYKSDSIIDNSNTTSNSSQLNSLVDMQSEITYGETLTITVTPQLAPRTTLALNTDEVELIVDDEIIATGSLNSVTNKYVINYNTSNRKLSIGKNNITLRFTGNSNLNSSSYNTVLTLLPKELTATYDLSYQYDNIPNKTVNLVLDGLLDADLDKNITASADLILDQSTLNVGNTPTITSMSIDLSDNYYSLTADKVNGNITITKSTLSNVNKDVHIKNKLAYSQDVVVSLPTLDNNLQYGQVTLHNPVVDSQIQNIITASNVEDNKFKVTSSYVNSDQEKVLGNVILTVSSTNFEDFDIIYQLSTINKLLPTLEILSVSNLTYGDKLEDTDIEYKASYQNSTVTGTILINNPKSILGAGTHSITVTFIPDDYNTYDTVYAETSITIKPLELILIKEPTVSDTLIYKDSLLNYTFINKGTFIDNQGNIITDYEIVWDNDAQTVLPNKEYTYTLISDNYTYTGSIVVFPVIELTQIQDGTVVSPNDVAFIPTNNNIQIEDNYILITGESEINVGTDIVITTDQDTNVHYKDITVNTQIIPVVFDEYGNLLAPTKSEISTSDDTYKITLKENAIITPDGKVNELTSIVINISDSYAIDGFGLNSDGDIIQIGEIVISLPNGITISNVLEDIITVLTPSNIQVNVSDINVHESYVVTNDTGIVAIQDTPTYTIPENSIIYEDRIELSIGSSLTVSLPLGDFTITSTSKEQPIIILEDGSIYLPSTGTISYPYGIGMGNITIPYDSILKFDKDGMLTIINVQTDSVIKIDTNDISKDKDTLLGNGVSLTSSTDKETDTSNEANTDVLNTSQSSIFSDIEDHWAREAIEELVKLGLINGYEDGTFRPDVYITRADTSLVIKNLLELDNKKIGYTESSFTDVSEIAYYNNSVSLVSYLGIMKGYGNGEFKPTSSITREEFIVVIGNLLDLGYITLTDQGLNPTFNDTNEISSWALPAFNKIISTGIISGDTNGNFNPKAKITRAELVSIVYRIINN